MAQLQAGRPTSPADGYVQPLLPDKEDEVQLEQIRYVALTIKCLTWADDWQQLVRVQEV
jgi:hypothetical protein